MTSKTVVVTGASTGIGRAIAEELVRKGFMVFGTVRRQADADRLKDELGARFEPLLLDVTDKPAVERAAQQVRTFLGKSRLVGLVNNAGIVVTGPLLHLDLEDLRHQLEVNLVAPLLVIQAFADLLGTDRTREGAPGRIVNISSVVGKMGPPFVGAYVASKHGLEGMSESLRRELMLYGIDVILVGPGAVVTPIWDKVEEARMALYRKTDYGPSIDKFAAYMFVEGRKGLPATAIADTVFTALTTRKPKVRYAVVPQRLKNWTIPGLLPKRLLDRLMGKEIGLLPRLR